MPVGQMLKTMTSVEITQWLAYYIVESEDERKAQLEMEAKSKLAHRRRRG